MGTITGDDMSYIKPRIPEKEIRLCFELFSKEEAIDRIIKYIKAADDLAEHQYKLLESCIEFDDNLRDLMKK